MVDVDQDVKSCFDDSRAFLSDGAKANNKSYDPNINPQKATDASYRIEAGTILRGLRDQHLSFVTTGQLMRETGNTFANCQEATSLAASYVAERMPDAVMTVVLLGMGDHCFLIVRPPYEITSLDSLRYTDGSTRSFAVDVWAGICCHTNEYPDQFREKMSTWERQGKLILVGHEGVKPTQWGNQVFSLDVLTQDPHELGFYWSIGKQRALEIMESNREKAILTVAKC